MKSTLMVTEVSRCSVAAFARKVGVTFGMNVAADKNALDSNPIHRQASSSFGGFSGKVGRICRDLCGFHRRMVETFGPPD